MENSEIGTDFGYYDRAENCTSCKKECTEDSKCGGVGCQTKGKFFSKCIWWKTESCGYSDRQDLSSINRKTCMKQDTGNKF